TTGGRAMTGEYSEIERRLRDAFAASEAIPQTWGDDDDVPARPNLAAHRRRWIAPALAAATIAALSTSFALFTGSGSGHTSATHPLAEVPAAASNAAPAPAASSVLIDPSVSETFTPAAASVAAQVGANNAFAHYAKLNGSSLTSPPQNVTVQLGYLTLPVG